MDFFFRYQKKTFNLENNKCICQGNFFTYSRIIFLAYLKDIYKTLKGMGQILFVSELKILLNL